MNGKDRKMNQKLSGKSGGFPPAGPAPRLNTAVFALAAAFFVAALLVLGACNTGTGSEPDADKKEFTDLPYGTHERQKLDLVFPDFPGNIGKAIPVVLYIHGGAWISGDKADGIFESVKKSAAAAGLAAASMNYRLLNNPSGAKCQDMLDDVQAAAVLIKKKSSDLGVEINKLCVIGFSAGAHLALLYSYARAGQSPLPIEFCISLSGPTDFLDPSWFSTGGMDYKLGLVNALTGKVFTGEDYTALGKKKSIAADKMEALEKISPITHAAQAVPTLLAHGKKDDVVPFTNAERLNTALPAGKKLGFVEFPNSGHGLDAGADSSIWNALFAKINELVSGLADKAG
ncbi:MAG: alpha/beta hydrolase [Treponema sp.]|jgi:acetyl esterase/lipase|nr:alpha/beta hydrolase [Treponema sp.]